LGVLGQHARLLLLLLLLGHARRQHGAQLLLHLLLPWGTLLLQPGLWP
jgi:hypothetical protein